MSVQNGIATHFSETNYIIKEGALLFKVYFIVSLLLQDPLEPANACKMKELLNEAKPLSHFHVTCCVFVR